MTGPVLDHGRDETWTALAVDGNAVHASHERLTRLIRARCGEGAAMVLARPELDAGGAVIGWTSPHGGALAVPQAPAKADLQARADEALAAIRALASETAAQGDAGTLAGYLLSLATTLPAGADGLRVDQGQPVLIHWGHVAPGQTTPPLPPSLAPPPPPPPPVIASAATGFPRALWAVPVVLLLLLGGLLWQLAQPPGVETVVVIPPAPPAHDPTPDLRQRIAALDAALRDVADLAPEFAGLCQSPAQAACAAAAAAPPPKELVIVLDASGSMEYSIDLPRALDLDIYNAWEQNRVIDLQYHIRRAEAVRGQQRIRITKTILRQTIDAAPRDVAIGMVAFRGCRDRPYYPLSGAVERPALTRWMDDIYPAEGTALAASLQDAASLLRGGKTADDPVNILLVSDGLDTCHGDPCAMARALKRARPGLRINVIDLAGFDAMKCVAEATGGLYRSHDDGMSVGELAMVTRSFAGAGGRCEP